MTSATKIKNLDCEKIFKLIEGGPTPKTFFNIGIGELESMDEALVFKAKFPDITVYGVEANHNFIEIRKENYPGEIFNFGIWSEKCKKTLAVPTHDEGRASLLNQTKTWAEEKNFDVNYTVGIDCITLDDFDEMVKHPNRIFLWMDIEGAELEALKGAQKLLSSKRIDYISLEVSSLGLPGTQLQRRHNEPTIFEIDDYLSEFGFKRKEIYSRASIFVNALYTREELQC